MCFLFDIYEIITNLTRKHVRPLTSSEILRGSKIFAQHIDFTLVMLDKYSLPVKHGMAHAFVTFNTINCCRPISPDTFIHELTHIWQYQRFGAGYIALALAAQKTKQGYNYAYEPHWYLSKNIYDFNAEQQADLIEDYYRIQQNIQPQWHISKKNYGDLQRLLDTMT